MSFEDATRSYNAALTNWEIDLATYLSGFKTTDEQKAQRHQFIVDRQDDYRKLMDLRTELQLVSENEHDRFVQAHERLANAEDRAATVAEITAQGATSEVVSKS